MARPQNSSHPFLQTLLPLLTLVAAISRPRPRPGGRGLNPGAQLPSLNASDSVPVPEWSWPAPLKKRTDGHGVQRGMGVEFMTVPFL